eukprot:GFUD01010825.1.p1 GENE.GFUD01010825.1~~GFUD01010825.1.p1  ORF type:complete len:327 (+),score=92.51 GFUD01010825.1:41-1021(+)
MTADIKSEGDYTQAISAPVMAAVHFMADWAPECATIKAVLEELAKDSDLAQVKFYQLQAESLPEISMKHEIVAVPTVLLFRQGKAIDRVDGVNAAELTKKVKSHAATKLSDLPLGPISAPKEDLDSKLKRLINAHKCMVFMKGHPNEPKCGFSKQTVAILDGLNAEYGTFDILTDDEVRQGLKTYSNWPTFPQLYIDGDLIGGLDIIKEMIEGGEFQTMIPIKVQLDDKLKKLVNKASVMVFMKGDPQTPKCGFSRQLMEILHETKLGFDTFDILTDEEVRQGLKKFSNWPTYPQVYVKGELIGGLDIIKEVKESGDLVPTLKGEA